MNCEVCGRKIEGSPVRVVIEGAMMNVCSECSKFGVTPSTWSPIPRKPVRSIVINTQVRRASTPLQVESEVELVEGYGRLIREAREKMGLSQEELAKLVKERLSVIKRVEAERMEPPASLARKLEKALKIKLYTYEASVASSTYKKRKDITLGDVVRLKE